MSSATKVYTEDDINGLKGGIRKWYDTNSANQGECSIASLHLIEAWKMLYHAGLSRQVEDMIWVFIQDHIKKTVEIGIVVKVTYQIDSSQVNIYSTIEDYTNKKGYTSKAHFNHHKNYIGSVSKLGLNPVSYKMNRYVTRDGCDMDIHKLPTCKDISELFSLKVVV